MEEEKDDEMEEEIGGGAISKEDETNEEVSTLWAALQAVELVQGDLQDYLNVDDQVVVGGTLTLAEIAAEISRPEADRTNMDRLMIILKLCFINNISLLVT